MFPRAISGCVPASILTRSRSWPKPSRYKGANAQCACGRSGARRRPSSRKLLEESLPRSKVIAVFAFLVVTVLLTMWVERRIIGRMQQRPGAVAVTGTEPASQLDHEGDRVGLGPRAVGTPRVGHASSS